MVTEPELEEKETMPVAVVTVACGCWTVKPPTRVSEPVGLVTVTSLEPTAAVGEPLTYMNLLLTLWARRLAGLQDRRLLPLSSGRLRELLPRWFEAPGAGQQVTPAARVLFAADLWNGRARHLRLLLVRLALAPTRIRAT